MRTRYIADGRTQNMSSLRDLSHKKIALLVCTNWHLHLENSKCKETTQSAVQERQRYRRFSTIDNTSLKTSQ
jgi:hypothetical protein